MEQRSMNNIVHAYSNVSIQTAVTFTRHIDELTILCVAIYNVQNIYHYLV